MNTKIKRVIMLIFNVIAIGMVIMSGIMKLSGGPEIKAVLTKAGVGPYIPMLGIMEITFAALYIYPKTMKVGFLLLTCYFAGAIAAELSHGGPVTNAIMVLVLIWIGAFLRDKSIFLPSSLPGRV
ncbi:DoxX family protein [Larkinella sp. VNQ87]|uniref:DoxX family protein n=1 Tax=Larkinella sp. VNQ87 TaxID=3400921 RepID=UPI003BFE8273